VVTTTSWQPVIAVPAGVAVNFLYMGSFHHVMAVQIAGVSSSFGMGQLYAAV